jgi:hypothetical protein
MGVIATSPNTPTLTHGANRASRVFESVDACTGTSIEMSLDAARMSAYATQPRQL